MLPFLEPKKASGVIMERRGKAGVKVANEVDAGGMSPDLKAAAEDFMRAIESKSVMDLASAIKAAFSICASAEADEGGVID